MLRKAIITTAGLFLLIAMAGSALLFTDVASAQISEDGADGAAAERSGTGRQGHRGGRNILSSEERAEVVANVLGISAEEVIAAKEDGTSFSDLAEANGASIDDIHAALYAASVDKVNELVASGEITAERGEQILARLELRNLARQVIDRDALKQVAADTLGVTVAELEAAKEDGTMSELVDASGVSKEELKAAVTEARDGMIDEAVANGELTEEQGEQLKARNGKHRDGDRERQEEAPATDSDA